MQHFDSISFHVFSFFNVVVFWFAFFAFNFEFDLISLCSVILQKRCVTRNCGDAKLRRSLSSSGLKVSFDGHIYFSMKRLSGWFISLFCNRKERLPVSQSAMFAAKVNVQLGLV